MLREVVIEEDAETAISLMKNMFDTVLTDPSTGMKFDFGQISGMPAKK